MKTWFLVGSITASLIVIASACESTSIRSVATATRDDASSGAVRSTLAAEFGTKLHEAKVMKSTFCADCHPAIYAEHEQNTHGRAFTDNEVRLATGHFDHGDCIRCHTPRPIFETGIGQNPIRRYHNLEEGNTCMTCHWQQDYDYASFTGGIECKAAFDDRVGEVEACASCHRNHGTPYQWEIAPTGKLDGKTCISCHMPLVRRPVAVGEKARSVRSHVFPGARSVKQLKRAYSYRTEIDGDHVVVEIENDGAGHHFPTELKQRSVESLVIVRDANGEEVSRSRMVFRDPYKRPYGLELPVNTQIRPGTTAVHRVPLRVAEGTVECQLFYKHYFPIEDHHPSLSSALEREMLDFSGITPSTELVQSDAGARYSTKDNLSAEQISPANLVDLADWNRGAVANQVEIPIPEGQSEEDIADLISLFQFPVPEGNRRAQDRLTEIGMPAVPALIEALSSWDNKTFKQASSVLRRIGDPAVPAILTALDDDALYTRYNARAIIAESDPGKFRGDASDQDSAMRSTVLDSLRRSLAMKNALDRRSALHTATALGLEELTDDAAKLLDDRDPDVVEAAAECIAAQRGANADPSQVAKIEKAMHEAYYPETKRALAVSLAECGSTAGIPVLLGGLDINDDLIREDYFESLFRVTGVHEGYNPWAPRHQRLADIADLQAWWAADGAPDAALRVADRVAPDVDHRAWKLVEKLADGKHDDNETVAQLVAMDRDAVPALVRGLKFPPGFADRRAQICNALRSIGDRAAAPALIRTLDDPVLGVAAWACYALQTCGDKASLEPIERYQARLMRIGAQGTVPANLDFDSLVEQVRATIRRFE